MTDRPEIISNFLSTHGWGTDLRDPLVGDASARRYLRLARGDERAILMDSPNPAEDVIPFIAIADILRRLGLSAPEIKAAQPDDGLLLLEDFGDGTFTRLIAQATDPAELYSLAVDALAVIHRDFRPDQASAITCPATTVAARPRAAGT